MKKVSYIQTDRDWEAFLDWFLQCYTRRDKLTVTVEKYRKKRSLTANAYYWTVCIPPLADHFGNRPDDMHRDILGEYVGWESYTVRGRTLFRPRRTSTTPETMDTMDFAGLIQTAQQIAAESGLILPDQHEQNN